MVSSLFRQVSLRKEFGRIYEDDPVFCRALVELRETNAIPPWSIEPADWLKSTSAPAISNFVQRWGLNFEQGAGHRAVCEALMHQKLEFSSAFVPRSYDQRRFFAGQESSIRIEFSWIPPLEDKAIVRKLTQALLKEEMERIDPTYSDLESKHLSKRDLKYVLWTKRYQCGETYTAIASSCRAKRQTVSQAVRRLAKEMGLVLRPTNRGGRLPH